MPTFLRMDGIDDYIRTPSVAFDRVTIDMVSRAANSTIYLDARNGIALSYLQKTGTGQENWGTGVTGLRVDSAVKSNNTNAIPIGSRCTIDVSFTAGTDDLNIFSSLSGTACVAGDIYSIRLYNGTALVAHYDMSKGTSEDQSGNGNHPTVVGGAWVTEEALPTRLSFDGVDDFVQVPGAFVGKQYAYSEFELDFEVNQREDWHGFVVIGGAFIGFNSNTTNVNIHANYEWVTLNGAPLTNGMPFPLNQRVTLRAKLKSSAVTMNQGLNVFTNSISQWVSGKVYRLRIWEGTELFSDYDTSIGNVQTGVMYDAAGSGRHATVSGAVWQTYGMSGTYLQMNGTTDWLTTPNGVTVDRIVMHIELSDVQPATGAYYLFDGREGSTSGNQMLSASTSWQLFRNALVNIKANGWTVGAAGVAILPNTGYVFDAEISPATTMPANSGIEFFTSYIKSATHTSAGKIYRIRGFLAGATVFDYDTSTGTVQDQSGNGRHATLNGGTWVGGTPSEGTIVELGGASTSGVTTSAALSVSKKLAGASTSSITEAGTLSKSVPLAGASVSSSEASAELKSTARLDGTSNSTVTESGTLYVSRELEGASTSSIDSAGELSISSNVGFSGELVATVTATAALSVSRKLAGGSLSASDALASLSVARELEGASEATIDATATLKNSMRLGGAAGSTVSASGELVTQSGFSGESASEVSASATLHMTKGMGGASTSSTIGAGAIKKLTGLIGESASEVESEGDMHRIMGFVGTWNSEVTGEASLHRIIEMSGEWVSTVEGAGDLFVGILNVRTVQIRGKWQPEYSIKGRHIELYRIRGAITMTIRNAPISAFSGDFIRIEDTITGEGDLPLPLTGCTAELVILKPNGISEHLRKEMQIINAEGGVLAVSLEELDTKSLPTGEYPLRVVLKNSANMPYTVSTGTLALQK